MDRPAIDEFTLNDWLYYQRNLSRSAFNRLKRVARSADIYVPPTVRGRNGAPRIIFEAKPSAMMMEQRIADVAALKTFKKELRTWASRVVEQLRISAAVNTGATGWRVPTEHRLGPSLRFNIKMDAKYHVEPTRIGFSFARHGIYLHYGAYKGHAGYQGSHWLDRLGRRRETDPESLYKAGLGSRKPVDWFNPVLQRNMDELADIVARYCGDMIIHSEYLYLA